MYGMHRTQNLISDSSKFSGCVLLCFSKDVACQVSHDSYKNSVVERHERTEQDKIRILSIESKHVKYCVYVQNVVS
jgi:hypothetical protein